MITLIAGTLPQLDDSYYSRKIRAHFRAYGTEYDFASFYDIDGAGVAAVFNGNMTVSVSDAFNADEVMSFIGMISPQELEICPSAAERLDLSEYEISHRTMFRFTKGEFPDDMTVFTSPKLDSVFGILRTGFELDGCYDMWLTDTSHRTRHGVSKVYLYKDTTVTMMFRDGKTAFFGMIATAPESRGKGQARELLRYIENAEDAECELFAKDTRVSFYEGIGFRKISEDNIYLRRKEI